MNRPTAVAISLSVTQLVTPEGSTRPELPKSLKERTIAVIVPSSPSSGAAVTIVSRAHSQRPIAVSIRLASSVARDSTHQAGRVRLSRMKLEKPPEQLLGPRRTAAFSRELPAKKDFFTNYWKLARGGGSRALR